MKKIFRIATAVLFILAALPATAHAAALRHEVLLPGDEDEWVLELQEKLYDLGYLTLSPTGYFGTNTQSAVIKFQQDSELVIDGKAGPLTRQTLLGEEYSVIPDTRIVLDAQSPAGQAEVPSGPEDTSTTRSDMLYPGDKGDAISDLQQKLKEYEFYDYPNITGYFGPVTEAAVRKFQRTHNLSVDGIMGPASLNLLYSDNVKKYMMYPGDRSEDIKTMQDRLRELGYFTGTSTGYYGNATINSVRAFQETHELTVDGKAGPLTRASLYSDEAKENPDKTSAVDPKNISSPGQSPATDTTPVANAGEQNASVSKMLEIANEQTGKTYSYGSAGPNSFDCSGFVYYVLKNSGVATSRLSSASYAAVSNWDTVTDINSLAVGDLVCFRSDNSSTISHIGIYLGGGSFIHAAPSVNGVAVSKMSSGYYLRNFLSAKRIF